MNKTLLSVMAAAGLIASGIALADSANIEIYGTLNTDFENVKGNSAIRSLSAGAPGQIGNAANGTAQPSRNRVQTNSSNIGFRGKEELGMGWNAIFQIESQINIDGSDSTKTATSATPNGTFSSRNTNVGLSSAKYGTIFYGIWDLPTKVMHNTIDAFYATGIGSGNAIYGTPGFNVVTTSQTGRVNGAASTIGTASSTTANTVTITGSGNAADASFDRRAGNSVQYWTPKIYGLSARFAYSADEQRSAETPLTPTFSINPTIYAASLAYEYGFDKYGSFRAGYTFEQHRDYFGLTALQSSALLTASPSVTNSTSRDNENSVVLSYKLDTRLGITTIGALWERLSYNNSDTTGPDLRHYQRDAYYYSLLHKIGDGTIRASFGDAHSGSCDRVNGSACSTSGLDARQYVIGYSYSLSKRTDVYTLYTVINNGNFAVYQLGNNNGVGITSGGSRQQALGLGIRHVF